MPFYKKQIWFQVILRFQELVQLKPAITDKRQGVVSPSTSCLFTRPSTLRFPCVPKIKVSNQDEGRNEGIIGEVNCNGIEETLKQVLTYYIQC